MAQNVAASRVARKDKDPKMELQRGAGEGRGPKRGGVPGPRSEAKSRS